MMPTPLPMPPKKHLKPWKSFDQQLALLKQRGLVIDDEAKALGYLKSIGYYRLSGYLYAFRQIDPHHTKNRLDYFVADSRFEDVRQLYMFDKKLRQLALDALERIEIALRVNITYSLGHYSPTAHKNPAYFDAKFDHQSWLDKYQSLVNRDKKSSFVAHHLTRYTDMPIWVGSEVWDFGTMSRLYQGMLAKDKDHIAKIYHLQSGKHLQSHLHAFNFIRNVSAHHGRLWNKPIIFKANLKGLDSQWQQLDVARAFVYFCLMKRMLDVICPSSTWGRRFLTLLDEFPQVHSGIISLDQMGVMNNPKGWDLWADT